MSVWNRLRGIEAEIGELQESHRTGRDLEELRAYAGRRVAFYQDVLGWSPWSKQVEAARALEEATLVTLVGANGVGKDAFLASEALYWAYAEGGFVLITAPTQRQIREILFGEIRRAWHRAGDLPGELFTSALRLGAESEGGIIGFTSTSVSSLTGFHGAKLLGVLSEAQGLEPEAWEGLLSCCVGSEDRIVASGNPLYPSGRFYEAAKSDAWHTITIPAADHPNIVEGREVIPGGPSVEWMERMAREYGEGSNTYRSRVLSEFPSQGEEALFGRVSLDAAAERWNSGELDDAKRDGPLVIAVDPARYGADDSCAAIRRGPVIEEIITWRNASTMETAEKVKKLAMEAGALPRFAAKLKNREAGSIVVDVVGLGAGVCDRLREWDFHVVAFNGGQFGFNQKKFRNTRAEAAWHLRDLLESGKVALPRDLRLFDELLATNWKPTPSGQVQIEAKVEIKSRIGRSPDRADAVMMAMSQQATGHKTETVNLFGPFAA